MQIEAMRWTVYATSGTGVGLEESIDVDSDATTEDMAKVIIHNDDVTPMDFVVLILTETFKRSLVFAEMIMLEAHQNGQAIVCAMSLEEAEAKVRMAHFLARANKYPLTFTIETDQ